MNKRVFDGRKWHFKAETFVNLLFNGMIVDGRGGGLVIGRAHDDGGILMFAQIPNGSYNVTGEVEGGEFIVNPLAYQQHRNRIQEINEFGQHCRDEPTLSQIPSATRTIHAAASPYNRMIWMHQEDTFIVNRLATEKYLSELQAINNEINTLNDCDLSILAIKGDAPSPT